MTDPRQRGFTLIELVIFIVVVSAGLAGILSVMNAVGKTSVDPLVRKQAISMADSILEEILLKSFNDPDGTNVGETGRADWDNVADYDGKTKTDFALLPAELARYAIGIEVVDDTTTLGTVASKRVTVTITQIIDTIPVVVFGEAVRVTGYRTNY